MGMRDRFADLELEDWESNIVLNTRVRKTIAQVNAGCELLPAIPGKKYRVIDIELIAYGGAVAAATSVEVEATQSGSGVDLLSVAVAGLTQSAIVNMIHTNSTVLADGASKVVNDVNTAINASKTGSAITTATGIDFNITYVLE